MRMRCIRSTESCNYFLVLDEGDMEVFKEVVVHPGTAKPRKPYRKSRDLTYRLDLFLDERKLFLSPRRANGEKATISYQGLACDGGQLYIQVEDNLRLDERIETLLAEITALSVEDKITLVRRWNGITLLTSVNPDDASCTILGNIELNATPKYLRELRYHQWLGLIKKKVSSWAGESAAKKRVGNIFVVCLGFLLRFVKEIIASIIGGVVVLYWKEILAWIRQGLAWMQ